METKRLATSNQEEKRRAMTLEALADKNTIDHAKVKEWADSLSTAHPLPIQHFSSRQGGSAG